MTPDELVMQRIKRARAVLLLNHPFFATLLMSMKMIVTRDIDPPTMGTNMRELYIHPDFVTSVSDPVLLFALAHEVLHVAFLHGMRLNSRNAHLWNVACDFAINLILKADGFAIWDKALYDEQYKGMTADQIYKLIIKDRKIKYVSPMLGDLHDPKIADKAEQARQEQQVRSRVAQAATAAKMQGKLTGELARAVGELIDPSVPWQDLLRDYMKRLSTGDENWSSPDRRSQSLGVYLPHRSSETMGPVIEIMDVSGSISAEELTQFASEGAVIAEDCHPESVRLVWADDRVTSEQYFENANEVEPEPKVVTGMTDMRVPLEHVEQYDPEVVILFTDGHTPWPDTEPSYQLIVCCTTDVDVPIGQVVRI